MRLLSQRFRCCKLSNSNPDISKPSPSSNRDSGATLRVKSEPKAWCVYLIVSSNSPIKSYVGVTVNFDRRCRKRFFELQRPMSNVWVNRAIFLKKHARIGSLLYKYRRINYQINLGQEDELCHEKLLKQHNGEIKGGAKATRAGRPWICACIICGFKDQSQVVCSACEFESKWKTVSSKMAHKRKKDDVADQTLRLLQHRQIALEKVKCIFDCNQIEFDWRLNPF